MALMFSFLAALKVTVKNSLKYEGHEYMCRGVRGPPFSPPLLLGNSHQAPPSLATDITVFSQCMAHANGSPGGCHWHVPSNGQWHMHK